MNIIYFFTFFLTTATNAAGCSWWQSKVSTHQVKSHERRGSKVSTHPRQEHCREKWKGADKMVKRFKNGKIRGWQFKENFKDWNKDEIKLFLEIFPLLPEWVEIEEYAFYRAATSIHIGNPATSEVTNGLIVIYDQFFKESSKAAIIVHESSHHLFKKLSIKEIEEFATISGWKEEVAKDRKVYILPPDALIKPDSAVSKEEDFTNHVEKFYENTNVYKKNYPKIYDFFQKRYLQ